MTIAIMQPYFFPYIGYWQLINSVDTFVIYDDVNFIKQGFINKNSLLSKGRAETFSLQLLGASSNKHINDIEVGSSGKKLLKTIAQNYIKAPHYKDVMPIIEKILNNEDKNLARFIGYSLEKISEYLKIDTKFIYSSEIEKDKNRKAQSKIIDICKTLNAKHYINAVGGQGLYDKETFKKENIRLSFIKTELVTYEQFKNEFVPYLSIIDIMMFNNKNKIKQMLNRYELV